MKAKLTVEHVPTGRTWEGFTKEINDGELEYLTKFCEDVTKSGEWFALETIPPSGESTAHIPKNILKDCVIYLNTYQ